MGRTSFIYNSIYNTASCYIVLKEKPYIRDSTLIWSKKYFISNIVYGKLCVIICSPKTQNLKNKNLYSVFICVHFKFSPEIRNWYSGASLYSGVTMYCCEGWWPFVCKEMTDKHLRTGHREEPARRWTELGDAHRSDVMLWEKWWRRDIFQHILLTSNWGTTYSRESFQCKQGRDSVSYPLGKEHGLTP